MTKNNKIQLSEIPVVICFEDYRIRVKKRTVRGNFVFENWTEEQLHLAIDDLRDFACQIEYNLELRKAKRERKK